MGQAMDAVRTRTSPPQRGQAPPVVAVGLHKVEPLWHLYILRKAMVDYCCLTFIFCLFLFPGLAFKANSPLLFAPWSRLLTRMKTSPVLRL